MNNPLSSPSSQSDPAPGEAGAGSSAGTTTDPSAAVPAPADPSTATAPDPSTPRRRTHPITPLVTGWKLVVGVIAVIAAQNVAQLLDEFTIRRALIGAGVLLVAALLAIVFSTLSWWFTTYAVDEGGVSLHTGMIRRSREYAPRARIESVSVERPLLARLLGLAKVRVEVAGGGESYLDIEYVKAAAAEDLRRGILGIAERAVPQTPGDGAPEAAAGGRLPRRPGRVPCRIPATPAMPRGGSSGS